MIPRFERFLILTISAMALAWGLSASMRAHAEKVRRNVEVEWEVVENASQYEVRVIRKDDKTKKGQRFIVKVPSWSATVAPGLYNMQIRSFDDRGAPGDWSPPADLLVKLPSVIQDSPKAGESLKVSDEKETETKLKWTEVPGASKYNVTVHSTTSDFKFEKVVEDNSVVVNVPVGQDFKWNVNAIDPKGENGDLNGEELAFHIQGPPIKKPEIQKPMSKYVKEVKWAAPPYANRFAYELYYKGQKSNKWVKVSQKNNVNDNKVAIDISRPSGKYRLKVQAHGNGRDSSKISTVEFEARGGFRDPAALEAAIMRDSITKPTNFYAISSYMLTQISYTGVNLDQNKRGTFSAVGGTGRIGIGYQDPESNWGGFGIVDMSGFTIGGKVFQFSSIELHATRKLEFGQKGLLLAGAGMFSKELPNVKGETNVITSKDEYVGTGKFTGMGPHAGFTFWFPLSERFGVQTNARGYYTLLGQSSLGGKALSSLSLQYGLLGTYRLSNNWMGYAGYAFRKDEGNFTTTNSTASGHNSIVIQGHYLNLLLEFSF